jgi:hypothetical protein
MCIYLLSLRQQYLRVGLILKLVWRLIWLLLLILFPVKVRSEHKNLLNLLFLFGLVACWKYFFSITGCHCSSRKIRISVAEIALGVTTFESLLILEIKVVQCNTFERVHRRILWRVVIRNILIASILGLYCLVWSVIVEAVYLRVCVATLYF